MNTNHSIIILLTLGLSILPSNVGGSESPDLPGNSTLMKALWPKQQLAERNATEIFDKPSNGTIEQLADKVMQLTVPIFGRLHRFPKYLRDLQRQVDAEMEQEKTNNPQDTTPKPVAGFLKLLRVLIQHVWKDASELINKKKMVGRVDEV